MPCIRTAILVTGTRVGSPTVSREVTDALGPFHTPERYVVLLHGRQTGADEAADQIGRRWRWNVWPLPYFDDYGDDGGMLRNSALASVLQTLGAVGFEQHAIAFPDKESSGTWGCVRLVKEIGVVAEVHHVGPRARARA